MALRCGIHEASNRARKHVGELVKIHQRAQHTEAWGRMHVRLDSEALVGLGGLGAPALGIAHEEKGVVGRGGMGRVCVVRI